MVLELGHTPAHACWSVRGHAGGSGRVTRFVSDGLARGERVVCVGLDECAVQRLSDLDDARRSGALVMHDCLTRASDVWLEPADHLRAIAETVDDALRSGYTGVRLLRDATAAMRGSARHRERQVCLEHLIDRFCMSHRLACACLYDIDAVGPEALTDVACVHRHADVGLTPFRLSMVQGADLALFGSVDTFSCVTFIETLGRLGTAPGRLVRLDLGNVTYIDHAALSALDEHGMRRGIVFELRRAPYTAERLARLLELRHVRVPLPLSIPGRRAPWIDVV